MDTTSEFGGMKIPMCELVNIRNYMFTQTCKKMHCIFSSLYQMCELVNLVNLFTIFLHKEKRRKEERDKKNMRYKYAMFTHEYNIMILLCLSCEHRCEHRNYMFTLTKGRSLNGPTGNSGDCATFAALML